MAILVLILLCLCFVPLFWGFDKFYITNYAGRGTVTEKDGVAASSALILYDAYGLWGNSNGMVYYSSQFNLYKVRYVNVNGILNTIAGTGSSSESGSLGGMATSFGLKAPWHLWGNNNTLYVADYGWNKVLRVSTTTGIITKFAGNGAASAVSFTDRSPATSTGISSPIGITGDTANNIYIAPNDGFRVVKVSTSGIATSIAGTGLLGATRSGIATSSNIGYLYAMTLDSLANVFVYDSYAWVVRKISTSGIISTFAGSFSTSSYEYVAATSSAIQYCPGAHFDTANNFYFTADYKVRRIDSSSGIVYTIAGTGLNSYDNAGEYGDAIAANFFDPMGIFVDTSNKVFVADFGLRILTTAIPPTPMPSILPSIIPSRDPTVVPTLKPTVSFRPSLLPTVSPTTIAPSVSNYPSILPTVKPSVLPTLSMKPTGTPSVKPTTMGPSVSRNPTTNPSLTPTTLLPSTAGSVTTFATSDPSEVPSTAPTTAEPTSDPSEVPSTAPTTAEPTSDPSELPSTAPTTAEPTSDPSKVPSTAPTNNPSVIPLGIPSTNPTAVSTRSPSVRPTVTPTAPSVFPSVRPTAVPSTHSPSIEPSVKPSTLPTVTPSVGPTRAPTIVATKTPSFEPSIKATIFPSTIPSIRPSRDPSVRPTKIPTVNPSTRPTLLPSLGPTDKPTETPSIEPSEFPSDPPTTIPSENPSTTPSMKPTTHPTAYPTIGPSISPSVSPSIVPTVPPTLQPTTVPSISPTLKPSGTPSEVPTVEPTLQPSLQPTMSPTEAPSTQPTMVPTVIPSEVPSETPTFEPSVMPTFKPSSRLPTRIPTVVPTKRPTVDPTVKPSYIPTVIPSIRLTKNPSVAPSRKPSEEPTVKPTYAPSLVPSTRPSVLPSVELSSETPTEAPTTLDYYQVHAKATLPSNKTISVIGTTIDFRIIVPFLSVSNAPFGTAFSDVLLTSGEETMVSYVVSGGSLSSSVKTADRFGRSVALDTSMRSAGVLRDVNGDGFADLIIGDGYSSRCYVMLGTELGLTRLTKGFTIFGESDGDLTGWSVSGAGDVNNDTLQDILIGAPFSRRVGAVYVIYGRRSNNFDIYLNNLTSLEGFALYGAQMSDYVGISVSSGGDVNGDGFDDIIFGGIMTSKFFAGATYIVYGGHAMTTMGSLASMTATQGYKLSGTSYGYYGYSVSAAGDVNGDGLDDVLIGSLPQRSTIVQKACVVFGSKSEPSDVFLSSLNPYQGVCITGGGATVSYVGDINNDGYNDIMIGGSLDSSLGGYIVYSNLSMLNKLPSSQTTVPTSMPFSAPSILKTIAPSPALTVFPSRQTTVSSSTPTLDPIVGPSMPSISPTFQLISSTESPSAPSPMLQSMKPSVSLTPGDQSSRMPTMTSILEPVTLKPTVVTLSRLPVSFPSLMPTSAAPTTEATLPSELNVNYINSGIILVNQTKSHQNYVVNTSEPVSIYNMMGNNRYTISQNTGSRLTIVYFNQSNDLIDLTRFQQITQFSQLLLTEGSVIMELPNAQIVHLLSLHVVDVNSSNFIFYKNPTIANHHSKVVATLSLVTGCLVAVGGCVFVCLVLWKLFRGRSEWTRKRKIPSHFLMSIESKLDIEEGIVRKFRDNRNVTVLTEIRSSDDHGGVDSIMLCNDSKTSNRDAVKSAMEKAVDIPTTAIELKNQRENIEVVQVLEGNKALPTPHKERSVRHNGRMLRVSRKTQRSTATINEGREMT